MKCLHCKQIETIQSGIPQGSILGPSFFSIYINDIVKCTNKFNCMLYADDTTLNSTVDSFDKEIDTIQRNISKELQNLCQWLDSNRLRLNIAKSKFMLFHMPQKIMPKLQFNLYGSLIEQVNELKIRKLRNRCIHLPYIRCEFGKISAKYQMHVILRELATLGNPPIYPMIDVNEDILSKSLTYYS